MNCENFLNERIPLESYNNQGLQLSSIWIAPGGRSVLVSVPAADALTDNDEQVQGDWYSLGWCLDLVQDSEKRRGLL